MLAMHNGKSSGVANALQDFYFWPNVQGIPQERDPGGIDKTVEEEIRACTFRGSSHQVLCCVLLQKRSLSRASSAWRTAKLS